MKKAIKTALFLGGLLGIPYAVNHLIFKLANAKKRTQIKDSYYDWRHGKIRYRVTGNGRPLLLVHDISAGAGLHEWEKNIASLSKHYTVYALDLLGFGSSDKPNLSYSSYLYITLINDFIQDVIGGSTCTAASGVSGSYMIMAYTFRPDLYEKILLISPELGSNPACRQAVWLGKLMESPLLGTSIYNIMTSKLFIRWFLKTHCFGDDDRVTSATVNQYYHSAHLGGVNAKYPLAALYSDFLSVSIENKLPGIKIPVHVLWGDCSELNPIENFNVIEELNESIALTVFEGCKHLLHVEQPVTFYKFCRRFF